jgi:hypothetical protein
MTNKILILVLIPAILIGQYWGERTTEQSFEQSSLYFNSYYLNTFGFLNFKSVASGLIDDPFLNLYLNPANLPDLGDTETKIYVDFRGDRTRAAVVDQFVVPIYDALDLYYYPQPDPRWLSTTRTEPEPIVSFGLLTYPLGNLNKRLFFGATYQIILKEERFYTMPYWIYNSNYYYDALGFRNEGVADMPVIDRYSAQDEMINQGHLYSALAGYNFSDRFKLGLAINGVIHSRDGDYLNASQDEYGFIDDSDWANKQLQARRQDYQHRDVSVGFIYQYDINTNLGLKAGILSGNADQRYNSEYKYNYTYNIPQESDEWSSSFSNSFTNQKWRHDGNTSYMSINFKRGIRGDKQIRAYYRYSNTNIDVKNTSVISDTSHYSSHWYYGYDQTWHDYLGNSSLSDLRSGMGKRRRYKHEAMLNFKWRLTMGSSLYTGIYLKFDENKIDSNEPVRVTRESQYDYDSSDDQNVYHRYYKLFEDKWLEWRYKARMWTFQIPVIMHFRLNENWGILLGITRILSSWEIEDQTTAYFKKRERTEDGEVKTETNFGERYTRPTQRITEDFTDVITSFDVAVSSELKIRLLLDPEFEQTFRIAQWWLSFEANL